MSQDKCPWCETEIGELWEYNLDDGDDTETECPNCERKINVALSISYDYTIKRSGCEHHLLDMHDYYFFAPSVIEFKCTNCHAEFYDWMLPGGRHPKIKDGGFTFVGKAIEVAKEKGLSK